MDNKQVILVLRTQRECRRMSLQKSFCKSSGSFTLGKRRNSSEYGNIEIAVKSIRCSINTLLGSPRKLICQCCGMPLEDDDVIGHNHDGSFNEDYCKWCYADGTYTYNDMDDLIEVCVKNMVSENFTEEQARSYMKELLPTLDYWKEI